MKTAITGPMGGKYLTRPVVFLSLLVLIAVILVVFRFTYGLGAATNHNNGYPHHCGTGLWRLRVGGFDLRLEQG
jgi:Ni/Fe-hydrogenase subunit HybB-like protein